MMGKKMTNDLLDAIWRLKLVVDKFAIDNESLVSIRLKRDTHSRLKNLVRANQMNNPRATGIHDLTPDGELRGFGILIEKDDCPNELLELKEYTKRLEQQIKNYSSVYTKLGE